MIAKGVTPYVAKIWVFESAGRLPAEEKKLIVPNANLKLTLTCRNGIAACVGDKSFLQRETVYRNHTDRTAKQFERAQHQKFYELSSDSYNT